MGYSLEELRSRYVWELVSEDFRDEVRETIRRRLRGEKIDREYTELSVYTKEGKLKIARFYATTVELEDGFAGLAVGTDVTKEKELKEELRREKEKLELILTNSHDIVVVVDEEGITRVRRSKGSWAGKRGGDREEYSSVYSPIGSAKGREDQGGGVSGTPAGFSRLSTG